MSTDKFRLTVAGGTKVGGVATLFDLSQRARPLLESGWSVFLRKVTLPSFSVEVKWTNSGELLTIPSDQSTTPDWMGQLPLLFSPGN